VDVQDILLASFHIVTIGFSLLIIYCEVTNFILNNTASQKSSAQLAVKLPEFSIINSQAEKIFQKAEEVTAPCIETEDSKLEVSESANTYLSVLTARPLLLVTEPKTVDLTKFRDSVVPASLPKEQVQLSNMDIKLLRKECEQQGIQWRNTVIDDKTGKRRHLRKAEMIAVLQQKLSA
jgi:hypothetical protein